MEFFKSIGCPKYAIAPMVDQSELAFRALCEQHGTTLHYTPMFHALSFLTQPLYRRQQLSFNFDGYKGKVHLLDHFTQ